MTDISCQGDTLTVNGEEIQMRRAIRSAVSKDDVLIVLLAPANDDPQNIIAFDTGGNKLWDIEPVYMHSREDYSSYTGLVLKEDTVIAANWNSKDYEVDVETGEVTRIRTTK